MPQLKTLALPAAAAAIAALLVAAQRPAALAIAQGGLWEVDERVGGDPPRRLCVADPAMLANIEHRGQTCTRVVISESGSSALFHYTCAGGGFGRSQLTLITARSIRIETQGISNNAPFHHVLQARRVGSC